MPVRPVVFLNTAAGTRASRMRDLSAALDAAGISPELRPVRPVELAEEITDVAAGEEVVGVFGGDGSLATAAGILAGTETTLAVFPGGTLNNFARRLGISDLAIASRALADGKSSSVPLGTVDDAVFLNTTTFGFYSGVVRRRERLRRWVGKWPAAFVGFAESLIRMPRYELTLVVQGKVLPRSTPLIWVGIGRGSFAQPIEQGDRRIEANLEIVILRPRSRLGMLRLLRRVTAFLLRGEQPFEDPGLEILHARSALVEGPACIGATLDGEVVDLRPPLLIGVIDHALRVITP